MRIKLVCVVALMALFLASGVRGAPETASPSEGIAVHGAWTIDVYNEDGTLDQHVEFSNALLDSGGAALTSMLARQSSPGPWMVVLYNGAQDAPCPSFCRVGEAGWPDATESNDLTVQVVTGPPDVLRLAGSVTATQDGDVTSVRTWISPCDSATAPDNCAGGGAIVPFTDKTLDTPVLGITIGQTIQVQVDISFTSG
jgi:hypothetical protein